MDEWEFSGKKCGKKHEPCCKYTFLLVKKIKYYKSLIILDKQENKLALSYS